MTDVRVATVGAVSSRGRAGGDDDLSSGDAGTAPAAPARRPGNLSPEQIASAGGWRWSGL